MLKSQVLAALKAEIHRRDFSHFVENPPSVAQGGKGVVVVSGCPMCQKRLNTMPQFLGHLCDDVLPGLLDRLTRVLILRLWRTDNVGWKRIAAEMGVGVGTIYRVALDGSKIRERVF